MQLICFCYAIISAYIAYSYYYSAIRKQTKMTIGLKHISKATGYAISTVSRVLTNKVQILLVQKKYYRLHEKWVIANTEAP